MIIRETLPFSRLIMETRSDTQAAFIGDWAKKIKALKLTAPAILLLEMNKPLGFIAGQFLLLGQPLFDSLLPPRISANAINLLSHRHNIDALLQQLTIGNEELAINSKTRNLKSETRN